MVLSICKQLININSDIVQSSQIINICEYRLMVKKTAVASGGQKILTLKEYLRHSSIRLERHIFNKNSKRIREFLDQNMQNSRISFQTHDKFMDILRETRREAEMRSSEGEKCETVDRESEQDRQKIHREVSLSRELQVLLDRSKPSYQKSCRVFRGLSLMQKYGHLVGLEQEQQHKSEQGELTVEQESALRKIKGLYGRYKVSNMYKSNIYSKIRRNYIQTLIRKGYLREKEQIISLTS